MHLFDLLRRGVLPLLVLGALGAQDVTITKPVWRVAHDAPDELPVLKSAPRIVYPEAMRGSGEIGYVVFDVILDEKGQTLVFHPHATQLAFERAAHMLDRGYSWSPGRREKRGVNTATSFAVIFNPASAADKIPDATPRLTEVAVARVPGLKNRKTTDVFPDIVVSADVTVDETGRIAAVRGVAPELQRPIEIAASAWRFAPARRGGAAVAAELRTAFVVVTGSEEVGVGAGTKMPPRAITQARPVYPREMRASGLRGEVVVDFIVDIEGRVRNAYAARSLNPAFDDPAIEAVRQWKFEPARVGNRPVSMHMQVPIIFTLDGERDGGGGPLSEVRKRDLSKLPEAFRYDTPPKPRGTVLAVYPYEQLRARVKGKASVAYIVDVRGRVVRADVREATAPEFGRALQAAVECFTFEPAIKSGKPGPALEGFLQEFSEDRAWQLVSDDDRALLRREEKRPETIFSLKDLDAAPVPRSRRPPQFPASIPETVVKGQAIVEFILDEEGRARLPRIVSATEEAFGYAAVQAVAAWRYEPPTRGGSPVAVRVRIPFDFDNDPAAK
ncbi:MAG: TonB family protein [Opitutaceae bacterium]|nr:TonB family protein [Opitutaceae bacterium]